jgi:molybdopterin synthase sulfur carrier subunit
MACAVRVLIPNPLLSYTHQARIVEASGGTLAQLLGDLDRQFAGFRYRIVDEQEHIRAHIKIFVDASQVRDLSTVLEGANEVMIVAALSGG